MPLEIILQDILKLLNWPFWLASLRPPSLTKSGNKNLFDVKTLMKNYERFKYIPSQFSVAHAIVDSEIFGSFSKHENESCRLNFPTRLYPLWIKSVDQIELFGSSAMGSSFSCFAMHSQSL